MTDILVILDRSGSMESAKSDHEGGLKSFVADQQDLAGDVRFTLVQFDDHDPCEIIYDRVPIADVKDIRLIPRGGTPLLDAVGRAASHLEEKQRGETVDQTICMIITDGHENASREWTKARVVERVKDLETRGWTFLFLGANVDAFGEAGALGIAPATAAAYNNFSAQSVNQAYRTTSSNVARSRTLGAAGGSRQEVAAALSYSADQRAAMAGDDEDLLKIIKSRTGEQ